MRDPHSPQYMRGEYAYRALLAHGSYAGREYRGPHDMDERVIDLLTDLLFMLEDYGCDIDELLKVAKETYEKEKDA